MLMLQLALVDCYLTPESEENKFWKISFKDHNIPVDKFVETLAEYLLGPKILLPSTVLYNVVKEFLTVTPSGGSTADVSLQQFKNFLIWFGPLR